MSKIGRGMLRARSLDEYKELLKEALYEIDERDFLLIELNELTKLKILLLIL